MNSNRVYSDYLEDILDAIMKAADFIKDMTFDDFAKDEKTMFAVIRALEIIGEAAKHIPEEIITNYPKLPWREMAGIRNKLIHEYFGVNNKVVWKTVTEDLPNLEQEVRHIIAQFRKE
ncbi:MAG: DUF86 domain-containing protein [Candidatus Brocadiales bacterium]|nr:DUF86 domain-containing protein [Candidatus Brocadiales bacterium]